MIVIVMESADIAVVAAVAIVATVAVDVDAAVEHAARNTSGLVALELVVGGAALEFH